ncbi:MAG: hypothetical protein R3A10_14675 [Caldilineaceae bacterium]
MDARFQFDEVREAMRDMMELLNQMGMSKERLEQMRGLIKANEQALQEQMNQFAGQRIAENMSEQLPQGENIDELMDRPFWPPLGQRDAGAASGGAPPGQLAAQSHRPAPAPKTGQLDAKATIRANLNTTACPSGDPPPRTTGSSPNWWWSATSARPCATAPS